MTTNSVKNVQAFCEKHDLNIFTSIIHCSRIWGKHHAFKKYASDHKIQLQEMIYIADEIRDIDAAQKAHVDILAVGWGYNTPETLQAHHPNYFVESPEELLETFVSKTSS